MSVENFDARSRHRPLPELLRGKKPLAGKDSSPQSLIMKSELEALPASARCSTSSESSRANKQSSSIQRASRRPSSPRKSYRCWKKGEK